jgi:hypothetical protein
LARAASRPWSPMRGPCADPFHCAAHSSKSFGLPQRICLGRRSRFSLDH